MSHHVNRLDTAAGSNRLPVLMAEIKSANVVFESAQRTTADAAFVMGKALIEAKDLCPHGEWSTFLEQSGVPKRSAQRYMRLVRSGFDAEYVGVVGVAEALRQIDKAQEVMPPDDRTVFATWDSDLSPDIMMWWRTGRHLGGFVQVYSEGDHAKMFMIREDFPVVHIAFLVDCFDNGLMQDNPRPRRFTTEISHEERDRKIAFLQDEARKFAEMHAEPEKEEPAG